MRMRTLTLALVVLAAPALRAQSSTMADTTHHAKPAMTRGHGRRMSGTSGQMNGSMSSDHGSMMADTGMKKHDQMMNGSMPAGNGQMNGSTSSEHGAMMSDSTMKPQGRMMSDSTMHGRRKGKRHQATPAMAH